MSGPVETAAAALVKAEEARVLAERIAVANAFHDDGTWKAELFGHAERASAALAEAQRELAGLVLHCRRARP